MTGGVHSDAPGMRPASATNYGRPETFPLCQKVLRTAQSPGAQTSPAPKPEITAHERPHRLSRPESPFRPTSTRRCFRSGADTTPYKKITAEGVRVEKVLGKDMLVVSREALRALSEAAFGDINHYLRPGHLKQLRSILDDKEASDNDKFVAFDFLKNANIAAGGVLPMCQDTGTAIIMGKKGCNVITDGDDEAALSRRRARRLSAPQPALFAGGAAVDV